MHRIIVPITLLLLIIAGLFAGIYFTNQKKAQDAVQNTAPANSTGNKPQPPLLISFIPNTIKLASSGENKVTADIQIDSGTEAISSVTIKILCDPKRVKNLTVTQKRDRYSALSYSFADSRALVNNTNCEAELTLTTPTAQGGTGIVVQISATVTGNTPTEIVINPASSATTNVIDREFEIKRVNLELTNE